MTPMFNTAIWKKTWGDQRVLVLSFVALWSAFPWIYIWLSSQIPMPAFQDVLLRAIPQDWQRLSGVPFSEVATHAGRVALAFVDPVVVLAATVFGITRGSDAVSGPLERGTMEMVLAQPVNRVAVFVSQALATIAAAALLSAVLFAAAASAVATRRAPSVWAARWLASTSARMRSTSCSASTAAVSSSLIGSTPDL